MPDRVTSPLASVVELTGISRHVPVYPTLQQAAHGSPPSG
jgi:hypothetical protein